MDLHLILSALRRFRDYRGWRKYHTPANLTAALSVEAAELQALFLWSGEDGWPEICQLDLGTRAAEECADVFIYLIQLADQLDINLEEAVWWKIRLNEQRFPAQGQMDWVSWRKDRGSDSP